MAKKVEPLSESYYYILLCLARGPGHGYGIMQETKRLSRGEVLIGSGTMYGATGNMMKKGWIEETASQMENGKRRRMYRLTPLGKEILDAEIGRLKRMLEGAEEIEWEGNHSETA
ncbi:MAG TPA: PadR family transcriptional regulator [Lachnospiraceae bacterium]|nr:PadR family transcriptional regulator [Lachnospiraceae bacterium]